MSARRSASDWLAHADAILAEHPVRRVRLTTIPRRIAHGPQAWGEEWYETLEGRAEPRFLLHSLVPDMLKATWPGIEFELPPATGTNAGE